MCIIFLGGSSFSGIALSLACASKRYLHVMSSLQAEFNSCLFHSSSALHRRLEQLAEKHFKEVGLTTTQGFILMTLKEAPGIAVSDLALVHQVVHSTITRMLNVLEKEKLVHRETMGRYKRVFATPEGSRKAEDARAAWKKLQHEYKLLIGAEEASFLAQEVTSTLAKLV